jgi:hypothetical protein
MKLRVLLCSLALFATAACLPNLDRIQQAIITAINNVMGGNAAKGAVSCAVVLFDQSIDPATNRALYTPVYPPNDPYIWIQACMTGPRHSVPTYKASGYNNGGDPNKNAVCWVINAPPPGELKFPCAFDTDARYNWVKYLGTSFNGKMVVGSLG